MTTQFTVRGSHTVFHRPERGTAHVTLAFEGPELPPVFDRVVAQLEAVKASTRALHDPADGPVTSWSTGHVRTWAQRPWSQDGEQLPLVHHASVGVEVCFSDFTALGAWVGYHVAETAGFTLDGVDWSLTEKNHLELERKVRSRAVHDAVRRAQEYADALGLGAVQAVAIADAGLLGSGLSPLGDGGAPFMRLAAASAKEGGAELELAPEDVEVAAEVHARFVAR